MALNVAYVDSVQIIYIETTLTKQVTWLFSGLCRFMNLEVYDVNMDYVDSLISTIHYTMWIICGFCGLLYTTVISTKVTA